VINSKKAKNKREKLSTWAVF